MVQGWTPMMKACKQNHLAIVKGLVEFGASINTADFQVAQLTATL